MREREQGAGLSGWRRGIVPLAALAAVLLTGFVAGCGAARTATDAPPLPAAAAGELPLAGGRQRLGTLAIARDVEISGHGRVREVRRILATDRFADLYRRYGDALRRTMRPGWQVETAEQDGRFVVTLTQEFADYDSFNRQRAGVISVEAHPLYEKIIYQDAVDSVTAELIERFPEPPGVSAEDWTRFLQESFHYRYRVTFPSAITSHNMDQVEKDVVEWSRTAGEVGTEPLLLKAEAKRYRTTPALITAGVILLLVGAVVAIRLTRRLWDPESPEA